MRYIDHAAPPPKPPKPASRGAAGVGAAVGHQAPRAKQIASHVQHYSENPRAHAKALRQLGVPAAQVQRVHRATMSTRQSRLAPLSTGEAKKLKPYTHQQALEKAAEIGLNQAGIRPNNVSGLSGVSHVFDRGPLAKTLTGLGEAGLYSVPGLAIGAKNLGAGTYHDINNISHGHLNRPSHGFKAAKAFVPNVRRDIHAARHGDLSGVILDAWMGAGIVGGVGARAGAAGRALHAGEGAARALKRPGFEGGSLLHKPEPGTFKMRVGDQVIERPLSRNPARAEIQKARWRRQQKQIDAHRTPEHALQEAKRGGPPPITGPTAEGSVGSQAVRQRRYQRSSELSAAHYEHAATRKFSGGQEAAARTIAIEGTHALTHPEEVIGRHIAKHTEWMNAPGADKVAHQDIIAQLKTALPVLKKQDPKFLNGVDALRQMNNHAEQGSIARDLLNPRTAERRKAEMAALYDSPNARTAPSISRAAQRLARAEKPSAGVERAANRVARLEKLRSHAIAKESASVTNGPKKLYHGTSRGFDEFHGAHANNAALYGPGVYLTDNPQVASGYATTHGITHREPYNTLQEAERAQKVLHEKGIWSTVVPEKSYDFDGKPRQEWTLVHSEGSAPNVRIVRAAVRKKFDVRETLEPAEAARIVKLAGIQSERANDILAQAAKGPDRAVRFSGQHIYDLLDSHLGKARANQLLQKAGYHAIVHSGGQITKGVTHEVTVVLDPKRVQPYYRTPQGKTTHRPTVDRLGAALSVAKDDLQARVKTVDTRRTRLRKEFDVAKKSTIAAPEGSFYFHAAPYDKERAFGTGFNPRPSELGLNAQPQVGRYSPELMHRFRGQAAMHGYLPTNITEHSLQTFGRRVALHDVHDTLDMVKKMGSPVRQSWQDKAIRLDATGMAEMKRMLKAFEQHKDLTPGEEQNLMKGELDRLKQHIQGEDMMQANREVTPGTNTHDQGVVWYNERLLKDMGEIDPHGKAGKVVDSITNPLRFATLYGRLGYIWNIAGNAGMLAPEGVRGMYDAFKAPGQKFELSPENSHWIDSTVDVGRALGQTVTTGKFAKSTRAVAGWWNTVTDLAFRRAAFRLAARRLGYKTDADLTRLRTDPKLQSDRNEITQRARGIMGDYADLNPAERNVVRRALYFYPWTKVAYKWTGHMVGEHPIETAVLAQLSREEGQHVKDVLGRLPQWARLSGIIPIGHANKAGNILTTNLGGINTPLSAIQTSAALGNTVRGIANLPQTGSAGLADVATPPLAMLLQAGAPPQPGKPGGLPGQVEQLPFAAALRRAGVFGKPSKTYPARGIAPALEGLGGGPVPKLTSKTALNKAGEKEYLASLSPTDRVDHKYKTFYSQVEKATLATAAHTGKTHADAERALKWTRGRLALRRERSLARTNANANGAGKGKERYLADLSVLVAHKWVKPARAKELETWAQTAKPDDITKSITWLTDHYFDTNNELSATIKYLREHGDPNLTLTGLH